MRNPESPCVPQHYYVHNDSSVTTTPHKTITMSGNRRLLSQTETNCAMSVPKEVLFRQNNGPAVWNKLIVLQKEMRILVLGLDGAGKTAMLQSLELGPLKSTTSTTDSGLHFKVETLNYKNVLINSWDIGYSANGEDGISLGQSYYQNTQGIIFVVDSSDRDRIIEARDKLTSLLSNIELREAVLLVFANKQHLPNAMSTAAITYGLTLNTLSERKWLIQSLDSRTDYIGLYSGLVSAIL